MQKILLVKPNLNYPITKKGGVAIYNRIWPPLSLANCAAILEREKISVEIIDAHALRLKPKEVAEHSKNFDKIFVTFSTLDRWQCPHLDLEPFLKTVEKIKEKSNAKVYVIGAHPIVAPEKILELTKAEAVIRREPEEIVLEICKGEKNLSGIGGITFKDKDGKIVFNPDADPPDLKKIPIPAFHLLPMDKYFYEILGKKFTLFEGSRGCPFHCIFCLQTMYQGYRRKPVENLIHEVECAIENFGVKTAYFFDLEFNINKEFVDKLCDFLIDKNYDFRWCCQSRVDLMHESLLRKMKKAGCSLIHYGVESGSAKILELINKNITLEQIEEAIRLTRKAGIKTACFFMFGLPEETKADMQKTIDFSKKLNPTYASFRVATPYPGTEFYDIVKTQLKEESPVAYTGQCPLDELGKMANKAFKEFYLRPNYLFSRLKEGDIRSLMKQFRLFLGYIL